MAEPKELMEEAYKLGDRLFEIANEMAKAEHGNVAVLLHASRNQIARASDVFLGKKDVEDAFLETSEETYAARHSLAILSVLENK